MNDYIWTEGDFSCCRQCGNQFTQVAFESDGDECGSWIEPIGLYCPKCEWTDYDYTSDELKELAQSIDDISRY